MAFEEERKGILTLILTYTGQVESMRGYWSLYLIGVQAMSFTCNVVMHGSKISIFLTFDLKALREN